MKKDLSSQSSFKLKFENSSNFSGLNLRLSGFNFLTRPSSFLWTLLLAGILNLFSFSIALNAESIIKFKVINGCLVVVPVSIDGKGPFDFMIDTGSDGTAIDLDLIRELGVKPTSTGILITAAAAKEVSAGYPLHHVQLGSRMIPEVKAMAMDSASLKLRKIRGVVGQDLLAQFNYFLDFKRHEMTIEEDNELSGRLIGNSKILNYQKLEGRWMVLVPREAGPALKMVLDAGANELVMYDCEKLSLEIDNGSLRPAQVATILGTQHLQAARLRRFEVGGIVLRNLLVILAKNGTGVEALPEDGSLPVRLFNGVYFNNTQGQVVLNPEFARTTQITFNRQ